MGKRSIRLPRGPPLCSGMTPWPSPWRLLADASIMISFIACCSRAAISHSTRKSDSRARQKSANATFQAPPWASSSCLRPARLMMACSCFSCGFSTAASPALALLLFGAATFERIDPAFQLGEARLDIQLHQAAARIDGQQGRLACYVRHQHDLHAFHGRAFLAHQLFHHIAHRIEHAVAKEDADEGTDHGGA